MDIESIYFFLPFSSIGDMNLRNRYFPTSFLALVTWIWERRILTPFSMQLRLGPGKHAFLGLFSSIGDRNLQNRHFPTYFHALVTWNIHIFRPSSMHWWHGFGIHAFLCPFLCIGDMDLDIMHFYAIFRRHLKG